MRYGFVIDHRKCIGCHACTVACKEENQVPLGAFRTWVKYVEKGAWPHTRRYFSVLRCNHCDDAPCVTICPTVALYRRDDGIVDFDGDRCIGCKSCMQGCPYDALYIDPNTNTAAKCHYCAHRLEVGLEPACVIVCPARAIIAGDLDDPRTEIARLVAREQVEVRKAEQGTRPKVYYVGADSAALTPALQGAAPTYLWGQRPEGETDLVEMVAALQAQEHGAAALARPVYDAPHAPRPWGWKVAAYLWTKSIAAGALLVTALAGSAWWGTTLTITAPAISLLFVLLTTALLVFDLKRPERFAYILVKPNWRSWLVWGAWILIAFGAAAGAWLLAGLYGRAVPDLVRLPVAALAVAAAGYSAFLFGQAEGRDFWQSPLVLPHLVVSSIVAGSAALLVASTLFPGHMPGAVSGRDDLRVDDVLAPLLFAALLVHGGLLLCEVLSRHPVRDAALAARLLTRGAYRRHFWGGVIVAGTLAPMVALILAAGNDSLAFTVLGAWLALGGLWLWEDLWVKAGQSIPLS
ncbi:MAG TPA: 4Fe-4S dicluster domain-containing protein [Methylomirabilota bacterium]|nr:4Fe-4S dicluster domain-containing protein [Methylomirabilota bacterium]